jgi:hypothetical protein
MPFISVPLDDVKEPKAVPEGEYDLRIIDAEDTESKKGNPMTVVRIAIEGEDAMPIRHYITYPDDNLPREQVQMRLLDLKRFLTCFGIPFDPSGFNSEDLAGATGRCMVIQEEANDESGNIYNRLRLPRLKE